jgi:RND family efflux transporter MFP subunit
MQFLRTKKFIIPAGLIVVGVPSTWLMMRAPAKAEASVVAHVKRGDFKVKVTTSGELRARKFVQINVPQNAQQAQVYQMKIQTLVPEGTVVKEGDVVAELDRSAIASTMADVQISLAKATAQYEQATLDSTLTLSTAREDMHNMELALEEKKLAKEQAAYEAPTIQRQAAIDYERAERAVARSKTDYVTRTGQAQAKMREVGADLERQRNRLRIIQEVMSQFTIHAPAPGMVIYVKEWNGRKRTAGSQVQPWDPGVATLPDLTLMESVTYVNEIDIRKVAVGQQVAITLDADPTRRLTGKVTGVANVGEQRPNQDAKVFEVKVTVDQADTTLRPGMTTGNSVLTYAVANVLSVPLEAVSSEGGVPFVYRQSGANVSKQEVETGTMNDDEVVVLRGLSENDQVLLTPPQDHDKMHVDRLPGSGVVPAPVVGGDTAIKPSVPLTGRASARGNGGTTPSKRPRSTPPSPARPTAPARATASAHQD